MSKEQRKEFKSNNKNMAKKEYFGYIEKGLDNDKKDYDYGYEDKKSDQLTTNTEISTPIIGIISEKRDVSTSAKPRWQQNPEKITQSVTKVFKCDNPNNKNNVDLVCLSEEYHEALRQRNMKTIYYYKFQQLATKVHELVSRRIQNLQGPYCIIDSGADLTQMGKGFTILDRQIQSSLVT